MLAKDIMVVRENIVSARPKESVLVAMRKMVYNKISSLLIMDPTKENEGSGIVTSYDLMKILVEHEDEGFDKKLHNIMSKNILSVQETDKVNYVANVMKKNGTHHLIVKDNNKKLVGMISSIDVIQYKSPDLKLNSWMIPRSY